MILDELEKIKSFGSDIKSSVTPEDSAVRDKGWVGTGTAGINI